MPRRASITNVSTAELRAEVQRRVNMLSDLLELRDDVDRQIAELTALAGQSVAPVALAASAAPTVAGKKRKRRGPGTYEVTAPEFIVSLLAGGKKLTTAQVKAAWKDAGRGGRPDNALTKLFKEGRIERTEIKGGQGSMYSLAGAAAKPAGTKAAKSVVAKKVARKSAKKTYPVTAEQFIIDLLKEKPLTTKQVNAAWKKAGRGSVADSHLSTLTKAGKLNRQSLGGKLGSEYSVA